MADAVATLSAIFTTELLIILALVTAATYFLTYRPVVAHIREIYFVNSDGFKRAWYLVIAAISIFLAGQFIHYMIDRGLVEATPGVEKIFDVAFGGILILALGQLILILARYVPRLMADERTVMKAIVKDIRRAIQIQDSKENLELDVSVGEDIYGGRPTLGPTLSLTHYRGVMLGMTQYLEQRFGELGDSILYAVGRQTGRSAAAAMIEDTGDREQAFELFLENLCAAGMGIPKVLQRTETRTNVQLNECCICSGIKPTGVAECHYLTGLFAGLFEALTGKFVDVREVKCNNKRDAYCEFQIDVGFPSPQHA